MLFYFYCPPFPSRPFQYQIYFSPMACAIKKGRVSAGVKDNIFSITNLSQLPPTTGWPNEVFISGIFNKAPIIAQHLCRCNIKCKSYTKSAFESSDVFAGDDQGSSPDLATLKSQRHRSESSDGRHFGYSITLARSEHCLSTGFAE